MFSGFKELMPQFSIREAGTDESRLPSASTCVNLLKVRDVDIISLFTLSY